MGMYTNIERQDLTTVGKCMMFVINVSLFFRIWDKVIGGSCMILVYVAVSIFIIFQRPLLNMKSSKEASEYLEKVWHQNILSFSHFLFNIGNLKTKFFNKLVCKNVVKFSYV